MICMPCFISRVCLARATETQTRAEQRRNSPSHGATRRCMHGAGGDTRDPSRVSSYNCVAAQQWRVRNRSKSNVGVVPPYKIHGKGLMKALRKGGMNPDRTRSITRMATDTSCSYVRLLHACCIWACMYVQCTADTP